MSGFNLNEASEKNTIDYQKPGIYDNVIITEVVAEKSSVKAVPYLKLVTKGTNGEVGSSARMFLSTVVGEGKKTSAWAITARHLVDLLKATNNVDEATAKSMINVENEQQLISKVSALLVGKPFRAKFKGEEGQKGGIFAVLSLVESMQVDKAASSLKFSIEKDIKKYEGPKTTEAPTSAAVNSDLPF